MLGNLHVMAHTMGCVHGSSNEILSEWDPGPTYVVQSLWDLEDQAIPPDQGFLSI